MRKLAFSLLLVPLVLVFSNSLWAQCPEEPLDRGECDTLHVTCFDSEQIPGGGPFYVRFPLLVTHDQTVPDDSIAGFAVPFTWVTTNPSAYCSLSLYWNAISTFYLSPDFERSIFRHIVEGEDTTYHNRMADLAADGSGRDWDTRILEVSTNPAHMHLALVTSGAQDQRWWEGDTVLLATLTFKLEDTMHVCMDTTFWPPETNLYFTRGDGQQYMPRDNLPECFKIGPASDFSIEAEPDTQEIQVGKPTNFDVTLTSLYGFSAPCTLSVSGLPQDASGGFVPNPITPTNTANLTITTATSSPPGTYDLTITATELSKAQIEHSTEVVLRLLRSDTLWIIAYSPVDLIVTDPVGDSISLDTNTILDATYVDTVDVNGDGDDDDSVTIPHSLVGEYLIEVIAEADAQPGDTYSIGIRINGSMSIDVAVGMPVPEPGEVDTAGYEVLPCLKGDANRDEVVNVADVVFLVNYLFRAGETPDPVDCGRVNCDEVVDIGDVVYLVNYLYRNGDPPCS